MENSRISNADHETVSQDLAADHVDSRAFEGAALPLISQNSEIAEFQLAQVEQTGSKTDRLTATEPQTNNPSQIVQITPDQANFVQLPPTTSIDDIRIEGRNLVLVQADGSRIVIINGALQIPTFMIGDVTLPQQALVAALQQQGVNVAAGPDGSYSAGNPDSGHQFTDSLAQNDRDPLNLIGLLDPSDGIGDDGGNGGSGNSNGLPFINPFQTVTASLSETGTSTGSFVTQSSTGRFGFGGVNASISSVTLFGEVELTDSGTQQLASLTSGGVPVVVSQNGGTVTGTANGVTIFTLVFDRATGDYTFTQFAAIDHPAGANSVNDVLELQFEYTVIDKSGNTVTGIGTVDITDSVPVASGGTAETLSEAALSGGNGTGSDATTSVSSATGSLNISWGADNTNTDQGGLGDRSVAFTNATVTASGEAGTALTSQGLAVSTIVLADGTLVGYTGGVAPTSLSGATGINPNIVFYATVSDTATGSYTFTLLQSLDDGTTSDAVQLTFNYTATDSDGDTAANSFTVTVNDDKPIVAIGAASEVTESALSNGNVANETLVTSASSTGSLNISWGADNANTGQGGAGDRSVAFTNATVTVSGEAGTALTSQGLAVSTTVLADGTLVGYTGSAVPGSTGAANVVFYATLSDVNNGSYGFTLVQSLDHASGANPLTLSFGYTARDSDGDTASNTFTLSIADDVPVTTGSITASQTLNDDAQAGGNVDGSDHVFATTGAAGALFAAGADGFATVSIADLPKLNAVFVDENGIGQTEAVTWTKTAVDGVTTWTASGDTSGNQVATLIINANGSYSFALSEPLAHTATGQDKGSLTFNYTVMDGDGDTATGSLTIDITDDVSVANVVTAGTTLSDVGLALSDVPTKPDPSKERLGPSGDLPLQVEAPVESPVHSVSGSGLFDRGADGFQSLTFTPPAGLEAIVIGEDGVAMQEELRYATTTDAAGHTILTATIGSSGLVAFTLDVAADGSYVFTTSAPLVHSGLGTDTLGVTIGFTVTDGDGDVATGGSLTIDVKDDVPVTTGSITAEQTLNDDAQAGGNVDGRTELVSNGDVSKTSGAAGALFTAGADGFASVSIGELPTFRAVFVDANGVGQTEAVNWGNASVSAGVTTWTAIGGASGNLVATLTINADGSYGFTLSEPLAHTASGADETSLTFNYTVTDGDGDTATGALTINVTDDVPVAHVVTAETTLSDAGLVVADAPAAGPDSRSEGRTVLADAPVETPVHSVSGTGLFDRGADGFQSLTFTTPEGVKAIVIGEDGVATQQALSYATTTDKTGQTILTATIGETDAVAFTLTVAADGSYVFTTSAPLVHPASGTDTLGVQIGFTVTDGDGDTATGALTINVKDDVPTITGAIADRTLAEVDLISSRHGTSTGNVGLNIGFGADGAATTGVTFANTTSASANITLVGSDGNTLDLAKLTSGGHALQYSLSSDGTTLTASYTEYRSTITVFTVSLSQDASHLNGAYNFTLNKPLDDVNGKSLLSSITLSFNVVGHDGDGDATQTQTFAVTVNDDTPQAVPTSAITLTEDAFPVIRNVFENSTKGADGATLTSVTIHGSDFAVDTRGLTSVHVAEGTYTFQANGTWSFNPALNQNNANGEPASFSFTITDRDGDTSTATQVITVTDGRAPTVSGPGFGSGTPNVSLTLDEADLQNGTTPNGRGAAESAASGWRNELSFTSHSDDIKVAFGATSGIQVSGLAANESIVWVKNGNELDGHLNSANGTLLITLKLSGTTTAAAGETTITPTITATLIHALDDGRNSDAVTITGVQVVATDTDGDTAIGTVKLTINDDAPTAIAGRAISLAEDAAAINYNVFDTSTKGADGATLTSVRIDSHDYAVAVSGMTTITVSEGTYKFQANGTWTFDPALNQNNANGEPASFSFTITDRDGDTSTATQVITVTDGRAPTVSGPGFGNGTPNVSLTLDEADLQNGTTPNGRGAAESAASGWRNELSFTSHSDDIKVAFGATSGIQVSGLAANESIVWVKNGNELDGHLNSANGTLLITLKLSGTTTAAAGETTITPTITATLIHALDDGRNSDAVTITGVQVVATDTDGDTAIGTVKLTINDDAPTAIAGRSISLAEDAASISYNVFDTSTKGADGATLTSVRIDSHDYAVAVSGMTTITVSEGTYKFQANGTWTFDPALNQNNANGEPASFSFTITDRDGDTSTATQVITVTDGRAPTVSGPGFGNGTPNVSLTLDEADLQNGTTPNGRGAAESAASGWRNELSFTSHSDDIKVAFGATSGIQVSGLAANESIVWVKNGNELDGHLNSANGTLLITLKLSGTTTAAAGETTITPTITATLIHALDDGRNSDAVTITGVQVVATDTDGDTAIGTVKLTINDDAPTAIAGRAISLAEDAASISHSVFDTSTTGADGATLTSVRIDSHDYAVAVSGMTTIAVAEGTYKFQANGTWTFDPALNQNNKYGADANFSFTITDGDGDTSTATQRITVTDGQGPIVSGSVSLAVSEAALSSGSTSSSNAEIMQSGNNNQLTFTPHSDNIAIAFGDTSNIVVGGLAFGEKIVWVSHNGNLEGHLNTANGVHLITLSISGQTIAAAGSSSVTPTITATLIHALDDGLNSDAVTIIGVKVVATDTDGDTTTGTVNLTISDDKPVTAAVAMQTLTENGLSGSNPPSASASLGIKFGADGAKALVFASPSVTATYVDQNNVVRALGSLTSGGQALTLKLESGVLNAYIVNSTVLVFSVALSQAGSGAYTFTLFKPLDHTDPIVGNSHAIDLTFAYTATDGDADSAGGSFTVEIAAAGTVSDHAISYSALSTGVAVNLTDVAQTISGITVAANTATDTPAAHVVGNDNVAGITKVIGSTADDTLVGGAGDTLVGDKGNDTFVAAGGIVTIEDLSDHDIIKVLNGATASITAAGDWTAASSTSNDGTATIIANGHNIDLSAATGSQGWSLTNDGNATGVTLVGSSKGDTIIGGSGNDKIDGGLGNDTLNGGEGDDEFTIGADIVDATQYGPRVFDLGTGTPLSVSLSGMSGTGDTIIGGSGDDTVVLAGAAGQGFVLDGRTTALSSLQGIEHIIGTDNNDLIAVAADYKSDAANGGITIDGGKGNDIIFGGAGDDTLNGGEGRDILVAGKGNDTIIGGMGSDTIYYNLGSGNDRVDGGATVVAGKESDTDTLHIVGDSQAHTFTIGELAAGTIGNIVSAIDKADLTVTIDGATAPAVRADGIEDLVFDLTSSGNTINFGNVSHTALAPDTITITQAAAATPST